MNNQLVMVPTKVDLTLYAGDTFAMRVNVMNSPFQNMTWTAEIRATRASPAKDAEFQVRPDENGAWLLLPAADSARLVDATRPERYSGQWDVQVEDPVNHLVITLAQGAINVMPDVTREVP